MQANVELGQREWRLGTGSSLEAANVATWRRAGSLTGRGEAIRGGPGKWAKATTPHGRMCAPCVLVGCSGSPGAAVAPGVCCTLCSTCACRSNQPDCRCGSGCSAQDLGVRSTVRRGQGWRSTPTREGLHGSSSEWKGVGAMMTATTRQHARLTPCDVSHGSHRTRVELTRGVLHRLHSGDFG